MLNENNLVEKSKSLIWSNLNNYKLNELRILEVYLSRINARDPESSTVRFTKQEYCDLMGLDYKISARDLKKYMKSFLGNVVTINTDKGWKQYVLFTKAEYENDEELGQGTMTISCNPELKYLFFDLVENRYIKYRLKNIVNLKSQYSIKLYSMLKDMNFGSHEWNVDLKELRQYLGATSKNYESFKEFNRAILKKCEKEINENTDITFSYEKVMKGRLTRRIIFKIKTKKETSEENFLGQIPGQIGVEDLIPLEDDIEEKSIAEGRKREIAEIVRRHMHDVNPGWTITDAKANELNDMIYDLIIEKKNLMDMDQKEIDVLKNEVLYKVLRKASAGNAQDIFGYLDHPGVWKSITERIKF